jgi:phage-related protein
MPDTNVRLFKSERGEVPLMKWLNEIEVVEPIGFANCLQRIDELRTLGHEMRMPGRERLGDSIYELRAKYKHTRYRIFYFFYGKDSDGKDRACLSHGLKKKVRKVPQEDLDTTVRRKALVDKDPVKHTTDWE